MYYLILGSCPLYPLSRDKFDWLKATYFGDSAKTMIFYSCAKLSSDVGTAKDCRVMWRILQVNQPDFHVNFLVLMISLLSNAHLTRTRTVGIFSCICNCSRTLWADMNTMRTFHIPFILLAPLRARGWKKKFFLFSVGDVKTT